MSLAATIINGATLQVGVGADGTLAYAPNNIIAPVGTQIEFIFDGKACNRYKDS